MIDSIQAFQAPLDSPGPRKPQTPQEAAKEFERILVRQFVEVMTKDMFKSQLGDEAPGWMDSMSEMQSDTMTDELAAHLTEQGTLNLSDLLLRQWGLDKQDGNDE